MSRITFLAVALVGTLAAPATRADADVAARQARAHVEQLRAQFPATQSHWQTGIVGPALVTGLQVPTEGTSAQARGEHFIAHHADLFGIAPADLVFAEENRAADRTIVHFAHRVDGRRVLRRGVTLTLDTAGHVTRVSNNIVPVHAVRGADIAPADARSLVLGRFSPEARAADVAHIETVIVAGPGGAFEAAVVHVVPHPQEMNVVEVLVDLHHGKVVGQRSAVQH